MTLTVTLAHFCDKHGPRSILCTQAIAIDLVDQLVLPEFSKESYCQSCSLILPDTEAREHKSMEDYHSKASNKPVTTLKTLDTKNDKAYASAQYSATSFRVLNSVVKKCLSEELLSYDATPLYFGDEVRGYSLCLGFKVKDLEARGSERRYVFVTNSDSEHQILESWDEIVENVTVLIEYLKEASAKQEQQQSQNNELYLRAKVQQPRSLTELLGDDELFLKIHLWCAKILRKVLATF